MPNGMPSNKDTLEFSLTTLQKHIIYISRQQIVTLWKQVLLIMLASVCGFMILLRMNRHGHSLVVKIYKDQILNQSSNGKTIMIQRSLNNMQQVYQLTALLLSAPLLISGLPIEIQILVKYYSLIVVGAIIEIHGSMTVLKMSAMIPKSKAGFS